MNSILKNFHVATRNRVFYVSMLSLFFYRAGNDLIIQTMPDKSNTGYYYQLIVHSTAYSALTGEINQRYSRISSAVYSYIAHPLPLPVARHPLRRRRRRHLPRSFPPPLEELRFRAATASDARTVRCKLLLQLFVFMTLWGGWVTPTPPSHPPDYLIWSQERHKLEIILRKL